MALFQYTCEICNGLVRALGNPLKPGELHNRGSGYRSDCKGVLVRDPGGVSTAIYETLDNGAMTKSLTRLQDSERLHRERVESADPLSGGRVQVERAR